MLTTGPVPIVVGLYLDVVPHDLVSDVLLEHRGIRTFPVASPGCGSSSGSLSGPRPSRVSPMILSRLETSSKRFPEASKQPLACHRAVILSETQTERSGFNVPGLTLDLEP